jgi:pyruvate formate lyase activating enzyme
MKQALLYDNGSPDKTIRCFACIRECKIPVGKTGFCRTRQNIDGELFSLYYGYFSGIRPGPLGAKPFLHFEDPETGRIYPEDEPTLSIGGFSCNFRCKGCQNVEVSSLPDNIEEVAIRKSPEEIVAEAKEKNIRIIAFTWNEPAIMPEIVLDIAKLAHENNIRTVYVCNGTPTKKHLDLIMPYMDAFRYDIKAGPGVGDEFYRHYCNLDLDDTVNKILESIKYTRDHGKHIEILTVLIPTYAPSCTRSVLKTAKWIRENLGEDTPWHLAKFFPAHKFNKPSLKTLDSAIDYFANLARTVDLKNVYAVKDKGCDCLKNEDSNSCCCCCGD